MRKGLAAMVAVLLVALLAACGSVNRESAGNNASAPNSSGSAAASVEEPVEIVVVSQVGPDGTETRDPIWDRVEQNVPGVKIKIVWATDSTTNKQNQLIAAHTPPDLIRGGDVYTTQYGDFLEPLDGYLEKAPDGMNAYESTIMQNLKYKDKTVWLPLNYNIGLLYYNKKLFDQEGLAYPTNDWTWDQYYEASKKLTKYESNHAATQWGSETTFGWWGEWLTWVREAGGDFMKDGKVVMDTPEAITGLKGFLRKTRGEDKSAPQPGESDLGGFAGGKVAMVYSGHTGNFATYNKVEGLQWDVVALPKGPGGGRGAELAVDAFGLSTSSKHKDKAWEVLKFLTSEQGMVGDLSKNGTPVVLKSAMEKALSVPADQRSNPAGLENIVLAAKEGMILPADADFVHMAINIAQSEIDLMLEGKQSPEEAAKRITEQANSYIATR